MGSGVEPAMAWGANTWGFAQEIQTYENIKYPNGFFAASFVTGLVDYLRWIKVTSGGKK